MQANGVRAAQLSVGKNGAMKFARAYTWAEEGYRQTAVSTRFLLASCSKMFLEAAVQTLYDNGKLKPSQAVYPLLGFTKPADPRSDQITIQQLLDHSGGYDDSSAGSGFDPTYAMRKIALELGLTQPVTKLDVARYMYARPLDFAPGTKSQYSNFGYLLAGAVVEKVTGLSYAAYVSKALVVPEDLKDVGVVSTLASGRSSDEAIVEAQGLGGDPIHLGSQLRVPDVYGGDSEINEVGAPQCGMGASATAIVRFIHKHAVWGNGPRAANTARAGSTPGASSLAVSRADGVDWAYVINTRDWPATGAETLKTLGDTITHVLDTVPLP
jgi:CubicO group peptidase (beta-lactamase class C family)